MPPVCGDARMGGQSSGGLELGRALVCRTVANLVHPPKYLARTSLFYTLYRCLVPQVPRMIQQEQFTMWFYSFSILY